jgi:hypothetical protein
LRFVAAAADSRDPRGDPPPAPPGSDQAKSATSTTQSRSNLAPRSSHSRATNPSSRAAAGSHRSRSIRSRTSVAETSTSTAAQEIVAAPSAAVSVQSRARTTPGLTDSSAPIASGSPTVRCHASRTDSRRDSERRCTAQATIAAQGISPASTKIVLTSRTRAAECAMNIDERPCSFDCRPDSPAHRPRARS